jgi:ATP synthase protein I
MPTPQDSRDGAISRLNARADALEKRTAPPVAESHGQAVNQAYRIVAELFGGVLVGLAIGFGVDRLLGTNPWGLIGGVLLGFALSVYLARRTANRLMALAQAEQAAKGAPVATPVAYDDEEQER